MVYAQNVYYVSSFGGSDDGTGKYDDPFQTIQKALDTAACYDTIHVEGGAYNTEPLLIKCDNLTIIGHDSFIYGIPTQNYPHLHNTNYLIYQKFINFNNHNHIYFQHFIIEHVYWGIWVDGDYNTVKDCYIYDYQADAINVIDGNNNNIINNIVGSAINGNIRDSITVEGSFTGQGFLPANNNLIQGNIIHNNNLHFGINFIVTRNNNGTYSPTSYCTGNIVRQNKIDSCYSGIYMVQQKDFDIDNNLIVHSIGNGPGYEGHGIHINYHAYDTLRTKYASSGKIYNNTLFKSKADGILSESAYHLEIINNIFLWHLIDTTGTRLIRIDSSFGNQFRNNLYFGDHYAWQIGPTYYNQQTWQSIDSKSKYNDPLLNDTTNEDYSLTEYSPAIDNGEDLSGGIYFGKDYVNTSRPQISGWDIGAFEFINPIPLYLLNANLTSPTTLELTFNKSLDEEKSLSKKLFYINDIDIKDIKIIASNKLELKTSAHNNNKEHIIILTNFKDRQNRDIAPQYRAAFYSSNNLYKRTITSGNSIITFSLSQNYPNPFNPITTIKCNISAEGKYLLKIYNVLGEEITVLNNGVLSRGEHQFSFNAANLPSGVYIYRLTGNNVNISKKMMLIK
jgi:hypothetical protein